MKQQDIEIARKFVASQKARLRKGSKITINPDTLEQQVYHTIEIKAPHNGVYYQYKIGDTYLWKTQAERDTILAQIATANDTQPMNQFQLSQDAQIGTLSNAQLAVLQRAIKNSFDCQFGIHKVFDRHGTQFEVFVLLMSDGTVLDCPHTKTAFEVWEMATHLSLAKRMMDGETSIPASAN